MTKSIIAAIVFFVTAAVTISMYLHFHQPSSSRKFRNIDNPRTPPQERKNVDATVSVTRPGAFKTVMEALQAAPVHATTKYVIHIEARSYNELVVVWENRTNIWLVGDGAEVTKITMARSYLTFSTYETATFCKLIISVQGAKFVAKGIAFENSASPGSQAVVLLSEASTSAFFRKEEFVANLGCPWFEYSTVIIMECNIDDIISPLGWGEWPPKPTDKLTHIEYKNRGPGANVNERVNWTGYHALDRAGEVEMYTVHQFIKGDAWLPPTEIPYYTGLTSL
ncbi:hypothetical protein BUALT_BualtUnG0034700 [Buddleja alternifolia]|uniref:Pectinesterase catalytic domain-containing protein n=1 Tax=Buddleja alternifolia TaxID=168488 RepID=A0AAV6W149_9LAMI|nr:hypothetical protein BUALT_BualtUnG0034700 [Buddleja alternifolia]